MPAYKDSKTGTWFVKFYCKDWTGENKQIKKRGFATKREALDYERNYKIRQENNLDMTFGEFWKLYTEDVKNYVKEYSFKGTHAEKVNKLTAKFDDKNQLFKRNLDVYMMAPIVGFLFQKKADVNSGDGTQKPTKIFPQQLIENSDDLAFTYRLIMLLDKKNAESVDERVDKAFRQFNSPQAENDEKLFDQYVLGGVGLILCASKDDEVVEYAMSRSMSPMMVAEYKLQLPDKKILERKLQELISTAEISDKDIP